MDLAEHLASIRLLLWTDLLVLGNSDLASPTALSLIAILANLVVVVQPLKVVAFEVWRWVGPLRCLVVIDLGRLRNILTFLTDRREHVLLA